MMSNRRGPWGLRMRSALLLQTALQFFYKMGVISLKVHTLVGMRQQLLEDYYMLFGVTFNLSFLLSP